MSSSEDNDDDGKFVEKERRKVNMVLSSRSCGIEEPFTEDIMNKAEFWVQRKPKIRERAKDIEQVILERMKQEASGEVKKRAKKGEEGMSREEELNLRVKKKTDKFAWF
jgi:hypothetical protein